MRALAARMAAQLTEQADNVNHSFDDRVRWAERATAARWALRAEVGETGWDPGHATTLTDWETDLVEAMTRPTIVGSRDRVAEVTRRASTVRWLRALLDTRRTLRQP
jgi:hypothetical protein